MAQLRIEDLERMKKEVLDSSLLLPGKRSVRITVHMGTCGISSGADKVLQALNTALESSGRTDIVITTSGCAGICNREPLITVERVGEEPVKYADVSPEKGVEIFRGHVLKGEIRPEWVFARGWEQKSPGSLKPPEFADKLPKVEDIPFFGMQELLVMRNRGLIQGEKIEEYIGRDGYFGAQKALNEMSPQQIIDEVKSSGIRGRGGAGFPTGMKWEFASKSRGDVKFVLCNADEGDPGAFMDRCVLESDPHAVLEGMIIAAKAIGSHQGYIYCRAEYPLAVKMLNLAIKQAREYGLLGKDILGSGFEFDLEVYRGAGAFVCGEETALMTSIEGKRGTPRPRPPFPAIEGLWKKPTILNNVETLANIPQILLKGGKWYAGRGTLRSKGTKVFALTGDVRNVGLVEVPMGISIGTIIHEIGGGIPKGKKLKAVQLGGPSGGCVPVQHLNTPVDYESIMQLGAIVGSGGMIVMDEDKCVVDVARFFMEFCRDESCGKCTPCRVGTQKMLDILTRICEGQGREGDIEKLEKWADIIKNTALCGLGQTAPNPVLSTIRYFRHEYESHIREKRCPAVVCSSLFKAPCMHACPIGMDIPAYISLIKANRLDDAYRVLLRTNPFPSICGRVCDHKCEAKCRRSTLDEPLSIKNLKRFITDQAVRPPVKPAGVTRKERIGVVGAGPSGLTAARDLAQMGYAVRVFDSLPEAGGMLRWGIPEYRLPRDVLRREIQDILDLGVELKLNTQIGRDISWEQLKNGFDAIYLAIGAQRSAAADLEGGDLRGVSGAVEFLRDLNLGKSGLVGERVAVIGGGNSAVDASRSALRLGASKVTLVYRRRREDMPAQEEEIRAAEQEGVVMRFLSAPLRAEGADGRVKRIVCQTMELSDFDAGGRRRTVPSKGQDFSLDVDQVILAVGQEVDFPSDSAPAGVALSKSRLIEVTKGTRTGTGASMIFAGGDAVSGPDTVVGAIAAGHHAALEIDSSICKRNGASPSVSETEEISIPMTVEEEVHEAPRACMPEAGCGDRIRDFREVELGLSTGDALKEAQRCLRCDVKA
ncbi:MAG: NADH-quinone oxidoreductase subunit NuoF [Deltaproteobacteria bacterium HGW-Deltaproteobacteria-15]|jgi:NADH-quinone oxidoreductase subunit F|nr:MAG: NADH-quinone oxidoreductase subunit NuoF [Deltaproteobacteria bacterium HGW-Deltaproteobacteria-15]